MRVWGVTGKCLSSHAWCATCCLSYLLCRVYKGFCFPYHIFFKSFFFLYTVPLTGSPYCHWCLARFKKTKVTFSFVIFFLLRDVMNMARGACPFFWRAFPPQRVIWIRGDMHSFRVGGGDDRCDFVCCWHHFVGGSRFHTALPYTHYSWDK